MKKPKTRKPREWWVVVRADGSLYDDRIFGQYGASSRVVMWNNMEPGLDLRAVEVRPVLPRATKRKVKK
jgi:hypothetical protein